MERQEWKESNSSSGIISLGELLASPKIEIPRQVGPWFINTETGVIEKTEGIWYEIDLASCTTAAEVLDWIMQVEAKTWVTDRDIAALVLAFYFAINPQATICSFGQASTLKDPEGLARQRMEEGL